MGWPLPLLYAVNEHIGRGFVRACSGGGSHVQLDRMGGNNRELKRTWVPLYPFNDWIVAEITAFLNPSTFRYKTFEIDGGQNMA